jgi:hypothetical protein
LTEAHLSQLELLSAPVLCFPHRMLRSTVADALATGGQRDLLDNHRR